MLLCNLDTFVPPLPADGSWDFSSVRLLKLGVLPVKALLAVGECVWASSGGHVFVIDARTHTMEVNDHHILIRGQVRMLHLRY